MLKKLLHTFSYFFVFNLRLPLKWVSSTKFFILSIHPRKFAAFCFSFNSKTKLHFLSSLKSVYFLAYPRFNGQKFQGLFSILFSLILLSYLFYAGIYFLSFSSLDSVLVFKPYEDLLLAVYWENRERILALVFLLFFLVILFIAIFQIIFNCDILNFSVYYSKYNKARDFSHVYRKVSGVEVVLENFYFGEVFSLPNLCGVRVYVLCFTGEGSSRFSFRIILDSSRKIMWGVRVCLDFFYFDKLFSSFSIHINLRDKDSFCLIKFMLGGFKRNLILNLVDFLLFLYNPGILENLIVKFFWSSVCSLYFYIFNIYAIPHHCEEISKDINILCVIRRRRLRLSVIYSPKVLVCVFGGFYENLFYILSVKLKEFRFWGNPLFANVINRIMKSCFKTSLVQVSFLNHDYLYLKNIIFYYNCSFFLFSVIIVLCCCPIIRDYEQLHPPIPYNYDHKVSTLSYLVEFISLEENYVFNGKDYDYSYFLKGLIGGDPSHIDYEYGFRNIANNSCYRGLLFIYRSDIYVVFGDLIVVRDLYKGEGFFIPYFNITAILPHISSTYNFSCLLLRFPRQMGGGPHFDRFLSGLFINTYWILSEDVHGEEVFLNFTAYRILMFYVKKKGLWVTSRFDELNFEGIATEFYVYIQKFRIKLLFESAFEFVSMNDTSHYLLGQYYLHQDFSSLYILLHGHFLTGKYFVVSPKYIKDRRLILPYDGEDLMSSAHLFIYDTSEGWVVDKELGIEGNFLPYLNNTILGDVHRDVEFNAFDDRVNSFGRLGVFYEKRRDGFCCKWKWDLRFKGQFDRTGGYVEIRSVLAAFGLGRNCNTIICTCMGAYFSLFCFTDGCSCNFKKYELVADCNGSLRLVINYYHINFLCLVSIPTVYPTFDGLLDVGNSVGRIDSYNFYCKNKVAISYFPYYFTADLTEHELASYQKYYMPEIMGEDIVSVISNNYILAYYLVQFVVDRERFLRACIYMVLETTQDLLDLECELLECSDYGFTLEELLHIFFLWKDCQIVEELVFRRYKGFLSFQSNFYKTHLTVEFSKARSTDYIESLTAGSLETMFKVGRWEPLNERFRGFIVDCNGVDWEKQEELLWYRLTVKEFVKGSSSSNFVNSRKSRSREVVPGLLYEKLGDIKVKSLEKPLHLGRVATKEGVTNFNWKDNVKMLKRIGVWDHVLDRPETYMRNVVFETEDGTFSDEEVFDESMKEILEKEDVWSSLQEDTAPSSEEQEEISQEQRVLGESEDAEADLEGDEEF